MARRVIKAITLDTRPPPDGLHNELRAQLSNDNDYEVCKQTESVLLRITLDMTSGHGIYLLR